MHDKHDHYRRRWRPRNAIEHYMRKLCRRFTLHNLLPAAVVVGVFLLPGLFFNPSRHLMSRVSQAQSGHPRCYAEEFGHDYPGGNNTIYQPFPAVDVSAQTEGSQYRLPDTVDTFENYAHRKSSRCNISSLSLHKPFSPLCHDRRSFLEAFTGGGRIGFDTPFMPRDCDMRWFATEEICEILSRFEKVIVVGDSMMRHIVGAINVLLRKDLGYGAVTGWNFGPEESEQCFCTHQMDVKACSMQGIYRTTDVLLHDSDSFACTKQLISLSPEDVHSPKYMSDVHLILELMLKYPLDPAELARFTELLPKVRPARPIAFVLGHGLWNDLDLQATVNWLQGILDTAYEAAPYLRPENLPRDSQFSEAPMAYVLMVTPNAAGLKKPDQWLVSQGDKALMGFENAVRDQIYYDGRMMGGKKAGKFLRRGVEHMGTWNMSIQMEKWDGVHLNLKGNLIKAMGVMNWLNHIEVERW